MGLRSGLRSGFGLGLGLGLGVGVAERASSGVDETEAVMKPRERACDMRSSRAAQGKARTCEEQTWLGPNPNPNPNQGALLLLSLGLEPYLVYRA